MTHVAPPARVRRPPGTAPAARSGGRVARVEHARREARTDEHTPGAPPAEDDPGTPGAVAERVARLLANPRRIRRA